MKIVVCGAGQVGYGIAERLAAEGNDVSVIDTAPALVAAVRDTLDARGIVGHAAHPEVLAEAGTADADLLIAVTLHDEVNIVACQVAHILFNVPTKIARIRAHSYLDPRWQELFVGDNLPIDVVISPESEVAETVLRRISLPGSLDTVLFAAESVAFLAIDCGASCPILGTPLGQLSELFPDLGATVTGILRDGAVFIPNAADQLYAGDVAYVVVAAPQIRRTLTLFGHEEPDAGRIVIAGGGHIGFAVARAMETRRLATRLRLLEQDRERAEAIADKLTRTVVLRGSALDPKVLEEAEVADADLMIALTNDEQVNILASAMAKRLGAKSSMALTNGRRFASLVKTFGVDAAVDPRSVTVSRILQYVRRGRIRAVHSLDNGLAEVIEAEALETSPLVGGPLSELDLPDGLRIGAVSRAGVFMRPTGQTRIKAKDRVVIFARADAVRQAEQLFRVGLEFF